MAERSEVEPLELLGWAGGLNREADPYQVELDETPDALNVDFGLKGDVRKRKGYSIFATDAFASDYVFEWKGHIIHVRTGRPVHHLVGTTSTASGIDVGVVPTGARDYAVVAASMNDFIYITNCQLSGSPARWDGTTWAGMADTDFDGTVNRFPRCRALVSAHSRFFAGNVLPATNPAKPSRIHFSNPLAPETWDANDFFDVAPDDGTEITGMTLFGDQIIVFKDRSIHALVGTNSLEFGVWPVDEKLGTSAPDTIANLGTRLIFFDHLTGVWVYDGADFVRVSDKISSHLLNGVNDTEIHKATGWTHKNRYYLSVPWGSDVVNSRTFVYDPRIDAWTEYDLGFADAVSAGTTPHAVGTNGSEGVQKLFDSSTDNGANIDAYVKTAWLSPASPSYQHRLRRLDLAASALGDFDVEVNMRRNFIIDPYREKIVNTLADGAIYGTAVYGEDSYGLGSDQVIARLGGWGGRWRSAQIEFAERTNGEFQINRAVMLVSTNVRTRGTT